MVHLEPCRATDLILSFKAIMHLAFNNDCRNPLHIPAIRPALREAEFISLLEMQAPEEIIDQIIEGMRIWQTRISIKLAYLLLKFQYAHFRMKRQ